MITAICVYLMVFSWAMMKYHSRIADEVCDFLEGLLLEEYPEVDTEEFQRVSKKAMYIMIGFLTVTMFVICVPLFVWQSLTFIKGILRGGQK